MAEKMIVPASRISCGPPVEAWVIPSWWFLSPLDAQDRALRGAGRRCQLYVRAGEIFGIAGGCRQWPERRCSMPLAGRYGRATRMAITIDGFPLGLLDTTGRRKHGLCAVPEERNGHAAVGEFTLSDNSVLNGARSPGHGDAGPDQFGCRKTYTGKVIADFAVKGAGPASTAGSLSGGTCRNTSWAGRSCRSRACSW